MLDKYGVSVTKHVTFLTEGVFIHVQKDILFYQFFVKHVFAILQQHIGLRVERTRVNLHALSNKL